MSSYVCVKSFSIGFPFNAERAVESFAAVVGGANSVHTSPFDEAFQSSTPFSERIARNVQSILKDESYLNRVVDPASGSWYVESLTNTLAEKAWTILQELDLKGGIIPALQNGKIQAQIQTVRVARFANIDVRKERIVGTNMYADKNEKEIESVETNSSTEVSLRDFSSEIEERVKSLFPNLEKTDGNEEIEPIPSIRWSMKFEKLRETTNKINKQTGTDAAVYLINLGQPAEHKPRTDFITGFFEVGGFRIHSSKSFLKPEEVVVEEEARIVILCGNDEAYVNKGREVVLAIKKNNPLLRIFVAGKLESTLFKDYQSVGLQDCIHIGTNCFEFLTTLQNEMGGIS